MYLYNNGQYFRQIYINNINLTVSSLESVLTDWDKCLLPIISNVCDWSTSLPLLLCWASRVKLLWRELWLANSHRLRRRRQEVGHYGIIKIRLHQSGWPTLFWESWHHLTITVRGYSLHVSQARWICAFRWKWISIPTVAPPPPQELLPTCQSTYRGLRASDQL